MFSLSWIYELNLNGYVPEMDGVLEYAPASK